MTNTSIRLSCALIAMVAVMTRAVCLWQYLHSPMAGMLSADHGFYWDWGTRISRGEWLGDSVFYQGPLYAYLLGIFRAAFGPLQNVVLCLQMLAGVATCLLIYGCGRRLFGQATGFIAGLIAALYGPFIYYECMIMKSFLSPLLTVTVLWSSLRYQERKTWQWMMLAGAATGLACLVRENHILLLPPVLWWCWRCNRATSDAPRTVPRRYAPLAVVIGSCGLVVLPCTLRNLVVTGDLVAVTAGGGEVLYMAQGPYAIGYYNAPPFIRADPQYEHSDFRVEAMRRNHRTLSAAESSRYWFREALSQIRSQPLRALRLSLTKSLILLNDYEVPDSSYFSVARQHLTILKWLPTFGAVCGCGLLGMLVARRCPEFPLLFGLLAAHALTVILLYNFGRFRLGILPVWILFSARGMVWVGMELARPQIQLPFRLLAAAVFITGLSIQSFLSPIGFADTDYTAQTRRRAEMLALRGRQLLDLELLRRRAAAEQDPTTRDREELARVYWLVGDKDNAESTLRGILARAPDHLQARHHLAVISGSRGSYDEAIHELRLIVREDPQQISARLDLAEILLAKSPLLMDEAAEELQTVLRIDGKVTDARLELANIRFLQNRDEDADRLLNEVLRTEPNHLGALQLLKKFNTLRSETEQQISTKQALGLRRRQSSGLHIETTVSRSDACRQWSPETFTGTGQSPIRASPIRASPTHQGPGIT